MTKYYEAILAPILDENIGGWYVYFIGPQPDDEKKMFFKNRADAMKALLDWEAQND